MCHSSDLEIPLNGGEEPAEETASPAPAAASNSRLPALRLVLSANGASLPLDRPSWTVYRAIHALSAASSGSEAHRDHIYT